VYGSIFTKGYAVLIVLFSCLGSGDAASTVTTDSIILVVFPHLSSNQLKNTIKKTKQNKKYIKIHIKNIKKIQKKKLGYGKPPLELTQLTQ